MNPPPAFASPVVPCRLATRSRSANVALDRDRRHVSRNGRGGPHIRHADLARLSQRAKVRYVPDEALAVLLPLCGR